MPRIRQLAQKYADEDFIKEVKCQKIQVGIKADYELASLLDISPPCLSKRLRHPETMTVKDLRGFIRILKLDPVFVLKMLGYSSKEIPKEEILEVGHES